MATHEFGIMQNKPGNERYDSYEPEKYDLVKIDGEYVENLLEEFEEIPCYWHTLSRAETNLAYCGITLIPPESAGSFIKVFRRHDKGQYHQILQLFECAKREQKYIIHYGL